MSKINQRFWLVFLLFILLLMYNSFYVIVQGEQGLLLHLGKVVNDKKGNPVIENPGFHFKWPLVNQAEVFDMRLQTSSIDDQQATKYIQWQIVDLSSYYLHTNGSFSQTTALLEQRVDPATFGVEIVSTFTEPDELSDDASAPILQKMREAQKQQNLKIRADADTKAAAIVIAAQENAAKLRAEGDAAAAKIYADAYNKNPDFYKFYQSLAAYQTVFSNKSKVIVLQPDSPFLKYFNTAGVIPAKRTQ